MDKPILLVRVVRFNKDPMTVGSFIFFCTAKFHIKNRIIKKVPDNAVFFFGNFSNKNPPYPHGQEGENTMKKIRITCFNIWYFALYRDSKPQINEECHQRCKDKKITRSPQRVCAIP